jgi:hypothetical protein
MELEPEQELFKSRNRNRNHNFSKVGTGTVKNSYGSTTLLGRTSKLQISCPQRVKIQLFIVHSFVSCLAALLDPVLNSVEHS